MSSHNHVRITVNGKKIRSSGGSSYTNFIKRPIEKYSDISTINSDIRFDDKLISDWSKINYIQYIFIHRHKCRTNRTVKKVITLTVVNEKIVEVHEILFTDNAQKLNSNSYKYKNLNYNTLLLP